MDPIYLSGVLLLDGHDYATPAAAVDAAVTWLTGQGVSQWDAESARPNMTATRAWYDDDGAQFVQESHANARPVTAINLPGSLMSAPGPA
jgi:hypothetical protein